MSSTGVLKQHPQGFAQVVINGVVVFEEAIAWIGRAQVLPGIFDMYSPLRSVVRCRVSFRQQFKACLIGGYKLPRVVVLSNQETSKARIIHAKTGSAFQSHELRSRGMQYVFKNTRDMNPSDTYRLQGQIGHQ